MGLFFKNKTTTVPGRRQNGSIGERVSPANLEQRYAFRRNRTLTGSASSHVQSSTETNAQLKSARVQAHELVKKRRYLGTLLLVVMLTSVLLYGIISEFTVGVAIKTQDTLVGLDGSYARTVQGYFSRRPIERLRFLLKTNELDHYLRTVHSEIASVKAEGSAGFGKSAFMVTMRKPIVSWSINGHQHFVDEAGTPFERNYFTSPPVQVVDNSGVRLTSGQPIASNRFLGFVGRVVGQAKAAGYTTQQVIIPSSTTRQIELRLQGIAYPIEFSIDRGAGEQVEDMARSVKWLQGRGITPEYVDVRISGKVYYR